MEFKGKVALVTGASSGIGKAIATQLVKEGATVAAVSRRKEVLENLAASLQAMHALSGSLPPGLINVFSADLSNAHERESCATAVLKKFGGIDILVHAAG